MEISDYFEAKTNLQKNLLEYIDDYEDNYEEIKLNLFDILENDESLKEKNEFILLIHLIVVISNNHRRYAGFFKKIEEILLYIKERIIQFLSNDEIFDIFQTNKRMIIFLLENNLINLNDRIVYILKLPKYQVPNKNYIDYFKPEIDKFDGIYDEDDFENYEDFIQKRKIGENENYLCQIIQKDLINEFVSYSSQLNINLNSKIKYSIFETNAFLINKNPTIIEYSAFYGSFQIFKYLYMNECELTSSLWLYAIHGNSSEIINFLEENHIKPKNGSYEKCLIESIKCHHNDIYEYIFENLFQYGKSDESNDTYNYLNTKKIKFYNFVIFDRHCYNNRFAFYDFCQYNYFQIVNLILNEVEGFDENEKQVFEERICREVI